MLVTVKNPLPWRTNLVEILETIFEQWDHYALISYEGMQRTSKAACSNGKAMDRSTFLKKVCRR